MSEFQAAIRSLRSVDWDFPISFSGSSRTLHWYPGTFPPEVPATLIQAFTSEGEVVFDPYGGSGTSGMESLRLGRRALVTEINPIGCAISYVAMGLVLLKIYRPDLLQSCFSTCEAVTRDRRREKAIAQLPTMEHGYSEEVDEALKELLSPTPSRFYEQLILQSPNWDALKPWYARDTLRHLKRATEFVESPGAFFPRILAWLGLSAICKPASSQTRSWGHIADNVLPKALEEKDVSRLLTNWMGRAKGMIGGLDILTERRPLELRASIEMHDWSSNALPLPKYAGASRLLITSPPYASAIDYTLAQRLSLYLAGYSDAEIAQLVLHETGARRKRFQAAPFEAWANTLADSLGRQLTVMQSSGVVALLLPHRESGRDIGFEWLEEVLNGEGWRRIAKVDRSIRQARARQSWTSIKKETLCIYSK